jgi:hypothetical protein
MASFEINSSNTDIDIQKLKLEIESSNILSAKVVSITTSSVGVKVLIDAPSSTSAAQLNTLKTTVIDTHDSLQRRRVLVYDSPDGTGSASNKDYVDVTASSTLSSANQYTDNKVAEEIAKLVSTAPAVLDTLGELSDALGDDPNFATTVSTRIGSAESRITTLEARPNITNLNAISDVVISSPSTNQVLQYTGSSWQNSSLASVAISNSYLDLNNRPTLSGLGGQLDDLVDVVITSPTSKGQLLINDGTTFVNSNTVESATASTKTLILKGAASQTANLFEIQDNSGTVLLSIDKNGSVASGIVPVARVTGLSDVATSGSYNDLTNKPTLSTAAGTGSYNDLIDKPTLASFTTLTSPTANEFLKYDGSAWINATIVAANITGLSTVATSGSYSDLLNKPTLSTAAGTGSYNDLTDKPTLSTVAGTGSYNDLLNKPAIPSSLDDLSDVAITSATKGNIVVHNGTQFVNSNTIESSGAAVKGLVVKAAASQTANILEVDHSDNSNIFAVSPSNIETTYNSVTSKETNASVTTTNATQTTLFSLTLADNTVYAFDVNLVGRLSSTTTKNIYGKITFSVFRNNGGAATLSADYGGPIIQSDSSGLPTYDFTVDVSSNDVRIRVTGAASETVKWGANIRYTQIS